jgi:hypothetical protein
MTSQQSPKKRLVDADALIEALRFKHLEANDCCEDDSYPNALLRVIEIVESFPTSEPDTPLEKALEELPRTDRR